MGKKNFRSWYRRTFDVPTEWDPDNRVLLNFGAVDYETTVFVNGHNATKHEGGYWAFEIDITEYLSKNGTNELYVISVSRDRLLISTQAGLCLGSHKSKHCAAPTREASARSTAHLVHALQRNLADGMARVGTHRAHYQNRPQRRHEWRW